MVATGLAVEAAVLHNFCWHRRWTWADRPTSQDVERTSVRPRGMARSSGARLLRFHMTNGLLSLAGNLLLMHLFVGLWGIPTGAVLNPRHVALAPRTERLCYPSGFGGLTKNPAGSDWNGRSLVGSLALISGRKE